LFQAPMADGRASGRYCPRCGSQFTTEAARCPHGVALKPVSDLKR
jgi:predicted amidophosphoribosyltransferase